MILTGHPIIFSDVKMKYSNSSWITHTPFAFFLASILKPAVYVELGVHTGQSYQTVCQAVKMLKIETECYGFYTGQGDDQECDFSFNKINNYNQKEYSKFSRLFRDSFDDGLQNFNDGTVDLLHINGFPTYESVKNDFETWLPKLSGRGVVIFHNTFIKDTDFTAWKFWEEISNKYPAFEFYHGNGLGVAAVGKSAGKDFIKFLEDEKMHSFYRKIFFSLGRSIQKSTFNEDLNNEVDHYKRQLGISAGTEASITGESVNKKTQLKASGGLLKFFHREKTNQPPVTATENSCVTILNNYNEYYMQTLDSIGSMNVPKPGSAKRKCAIFVMVKDENIFLPIWLKYYSRFFNGEDIYVFDHRTIDDSITECRKIYNFNVIPLSYPYSFDHEWFKFVAVNTQKKLLESYEYVMFTDVDEMIIPDRNKYKGLDDYINQMQGDYAQCLGYDLIHMEKDEAEYDASKSVLSQRKYWYHTYWYNKTLISRHTLNWGIGFHELIDSDPVVDRDLLLVHLHKLDFKRCWDKSFERARLKWLQSEIKANRGWQNRITDIDEFRYYYYGWPDEMEIVEIPWDFRMSDAF